MEIPAFPPSSWGKDKVTYRSDGRVERMCEHGVGHTRFVPRRLADQEAYWVHGCDGCCKKWEDEAPTPVDSPVARYDAAAVCLRSVGITLHTERGGALPVGFEVGKSLIIRSMKQHNGKVEIEVASPEGLLEAWGILRKS